MVETEPKITAFSFSKKPILACGNQHSAISDILPPISQNRPGTVNESEDHPTSADGVFSDNDTTQQAVSRDILKTFSFNNVDYDEQIRAPRMTNANFYTYSNHSMNRSSFASIDKKGKSKEIWQERSFELPAEESICDEPKDNEIKKYYPANFDLTQPTRRFSAPSNANTESNQKIAEDLQELTKNQKNYLKNERFKNQNESGIENDSVNGNESFLKAVGNLNINPTSRETYKGARIKNRPPNCSSSVKFMNRDGLELQQMYEQRKPLSIPAVLRPTTINTSPVQSTPSNFQCVTPPMTREDFTSEQQLHKLENDDENSDHIPISPTTPVVEIKSYPFVVTEEISKLRIREIISSSNLQAKEPTHEHWKPNNYTTKCMKCLDTLGTFFVPSRKRRHHCRYCGSLVCFDCLWQDDFSSSDGSQSSSQSSNKTSVPQTRSNTIESNSSTPLSSTSAVNLATESVGGVLIDCNANFIIPIFANLAKQNNQFDIHFKHCKVCVDCGNKYRYYVNELNTSIGENNSSPFVMIENPFVHQLRTSLLVTLDAKQKFIERGRQISGIRESEAQQKTTESQVTNISSDWSWSSF